MKIGIDLHGVAFEYPEFFTTLGKLFIEAGHEVHIITGAVLNDKLKEKLRKHAIVEGVNYSHFFSIVQHHLDLGNEVNFDENGNPWMDEDVWNRTKAEYCQNNNIEMHFDDEKKHLISFSTPSCLFLPGHNHDVLK
jgi:hypothetical protein